MKKELNKLYNQLKKAGLNSYASKVAAIYKKAQSDDDFVDVSETPNMYPYGKNKNKDKDNVGRVFWPEDNSEAVEEDLDAGRKPKARRSEGGGECEEIANALLALIGTDGDMDKYYPAAVNLINTIKKLYNHPELDYIYYPHKINVKSIYDLFNSAKIQNYDENGNWIPRDKIKKLQKYEGGGDLRFNLERLVTHAAEGNYGNIAHRLVGSLFKELNASAECVKSIFSTILDASPEDVQSKESLVRLFDSRLNFAKKDMAST